MNLTTIAADINRHHAEALAAAASAVEHAKAAGTLLLEVKAQLPHGEFLPWVKAHVAVSERQARRYMAAAAGKPAPERKAIAAPKSDTVSDLPEPKSDTMSHLPAPDEVGLASFPKLVEVPADDDDRPTADELLDEQQREIERLQAQIKSLTVTDTAAEHAKQIAIRQGVEARLSDSMDKCRMLQRELDNYGKRHAELRKVTGLQTWPEIIAAYRAMRAAA